MIFSKVIQKPDKLAQHLTELERVSYMTKTPSQRQIGGFRTMIDCSLGLEQASKSIKIIFIRVLSNLAEFFTRILLNLTQFF